jgi:hypothetical protein
MPERKILVEQLVMLYHEMEKYSPRNSMRKELIINFSSTFGVSVSTVRRALKSCGYNKEVKRSDYKSPRKISDSQMRYYCELIAAVQYGTTNKKGHHLSVTRSIGILEKYGFIVDGTLVKAPEGLLKKSTVYRYLKTYGLTPKSMNIEPVVTHFKATKSNELWQFDFSVSDQKVLQHPKRKLVDGKLRIASVIDDCSGALYQEYLYTSGEDVLSALHFFFRAMTKKNSPFIYGIPINIYMDNGPIAKSKIFLRVAKLLDINIITHMPKDTDGRRTTSRSKGKIERSFRTTKNSLESLYHYQPPKDLKEANIWLGTYTGEYNKDNHRKEEISRINTWKNNLPESGLREMCSWDQFCKIVREPINRQVGSDACININGTKYQLDSCLAGERVLVLTGVFDESVYIELEDNKYGPFFPFSGPIPFGKYRKHKKSEKEKLADRIETLSKKINIPRDVLFNRKRSIHELLRESEILADIKEISFEAKGNLENSFTDKIDAKLAIAKYLGEPLSHLSATIIQLIDCILEESLIKEEVFDKIQNLIENINSPKQDTVND